MKQRVKGLIATLGILGFIVGLPLALTAMAGSPIPDVWPGWTDITDTLTTPAMGMSLVMGVVKYVFWVFWVIGTISLLSEIIKQLRGLRPTAPRLRLQGVSARAVSTAFLLFAGTVSAATAQAAPAPAAETAAVVVTQQTSAAAPEKAERSKPVIHEVVAGDYLAAIAKQHYGDSKEWPRIWHANKGKRQPDGKLFTDPGHIEPSWQLEIPRLPAAKTKQDAPGKQKAAAAAAKPAGKEPKQPPQTPTDLDTAMHPPASAAATAPAPEPSVPEQPSAEPVAPADLGTPMYPTPGVPVQEGQAASEALTGTEQAGASLNNPLEDADLSPVLYTTAGITAAALGGFWLYRRRRSRQPASLRDMEKLVVADPERPDLVDEEMSTRLDRILAALAADFSNRSEAAPVIRAAFVSVDSVELVVSDETIAPPAPWQSSGRVTWKVDLKHATYATTVEHPWNLLTLVSIDNAGQLTLVNLDYAKVFHLTAETRRHQVEAVVGQLIQLDSERVQITAPAADEELRAALEANDIELTSPNSLDPAKAHVLVTDTVTEANLEAARQTGTAVLTSQASSDPSDWGIHITSDHTAVLLPFNALVVPQMIPWKTAPLEDMLQ